jgi:hypothetical protein
MGEQIYTQTQFSFRSTTDNRVQLDFVRASKRENEVLSLSLSLILLIPSFSCLRQLLTEERREQLQKN